MIPLLTSRVAGHPLLQTGSKVLCAFIQDPQWDKVHPSWVQSNLIESMELGAIRSSCLKLFFIKVWIEELFDCVGVGVCRNMYVFVM